MRVACYAICQNSMQQEILTDFLVSKISGMMKDPSCTRFFDSDAAGQRQEAESSTSGGEAALVRAAANDASKHEQPVAEATQKAEEPEEDEDLGEPEEFGDEQEDEEGGGSEGSRSL